MTHLTSPLPLRVWKAPEALAKDAHDAARSTLPSAIVLRYAVERCDVLTLDQAIAEQCDAYEARIFAPDGEIRWVEGRGAVLLWEGAEAPSLGPDWKVSKPPEVLDHLDRSYLLWGTADNAGEEVTSLYDFRIGMLKVPIRCSRVGARVAIIVREYLGDIDAYGNVGVLGDRLVELREVTRAS